MQTKTLNIVVREKLADMQLPMHYYLPYLHYSIKCLEGLYMDFDMSGNVKEVRLTPNSYDRVAIPAGAADVISVFGLYGGKKKLFHRNVFLTKVYNLDSGDSKIPYEIDGTAIPDFQEFTASTAMLEEYQYPTIYFPSDDYKYEYDVDLENGEVVLAAGHGLTYVYLQYRTNAISTSSANLVEDYAVPVIHAYIAYREAEATGQAQSMIMRLRDEYFTEKRNFRARKNPMSVTEIAKLMQR